MSTTLYQNTQFSIFSKDSFQDEIEKFILEEWNDFILSEKGIYTIEGKNRAGKTILIKMIMGILPPTVEGRNDQNVSIKGVNINVTKVREAYNNGLCAVFQDDVLIPTMTIREQIYLRHSARPGLSNYLWIFWYILVIIFLKGILEHTLGIFIRSVEKLSERATPSKQKIYPESKIDPEIKSWLLKFELKDDILDKYPSQLSGGTIAKVRIINALLTDNIQILFLDEALNAVAKSDCDNIIDILKNWSYQNNKTIVVVTHQHDEVFRWQPRKRFRIENKRISSVDAFDYDGLDTGIQINNNFITKFNSIGKAKNYFATLKRPYLVLIDKSTSNLPPIENMLGYLGMKGRQKDCGFFQIEISENTKSLEEYAKIIPDITAFFPKVEGTIFLIGGGTTINFGSFIAATLHRGLIEHIIIPTTLMAVADVAIGSKASLNIEVNKNGIAQKHILGTYTNPRAVIMDADFISALSYRERLIGLSECLKHGLLQDELMYKSVVNLIQSAIPDPLACFSIALKTQEYKSRTLITDPFEEKYGRILLYGHLHAHSLERFKELKISHGLSVYWGLLLDLRLASNETIFNEVLQALKNSILIAELNSVSEIIKSDSDLILKLQNVYNTDNKIQHYYAMNYFKIIKVDKVGQYDVIGSQINEQIVSWEQILNSINELSELLK